MLPLAIHLPSAEAEEAATSSLRTFLGTHCFDCHDTVMAKGGLDLEQLSRELTDREVFETWVKVHDKVRDGEMPPKKKPRPPESELAGFLNSLSATLIQAERTRMEEQGRAKVRRLNRFEYENCLREGLEAPWLQVADRLPEDGTAHLFNKVSDRLDISHVQMRKYLETAEHALRLALQSVAHPSRTERFYAREEPVMLHYLRWRPGLQTSATRAAIPLLGTTPQPEVIRGNQPLTVGEADPAMREREAMGFVSGTYAATTKYDFTRMDLPIDGRYRIRMKTYTFMAGPNGASGGNDHGLTGGRQEWWRPSRTVAFPGTRGEPITLYALADSGDSRWLTTFDSLPEPRVIEREVFLKAGEKIRPDATRLVRTRPGWKGNPNATTNGVPGFAMNWLEIEGPLHDESPPACYRVLFDDLPFRIDRDQQVRVISDKPDADARRLLVRFMRRMFRRPGIEEARVEPFLHVYREARRLGEDWTESMVAAFGAVLCSPDFLYLNLERGLSLSSKDEKEKVGLKPTLLSHAALAERLSFFLWNGPPDEALLTEDALTEPAILRGHTERLLNDPRSERFVNALLDYWLDFRDINANAPDAELYPDYYLDDWLTESSVRETRLFFTELLEKDLPARNLVDSEFAFVNERLARHYGLLGKDDPTIGQSEMETGTVSMEPDSDGLIVSSSDYSDTDGEEGHHLEGEAFAKVRLPANNPRGGLLTQASVLRVTANGTSTSPVMRGVWVMERILGSEIPPPPSGIEAITPDIRGAVTIREQLDKHRATESCAACHTKFDPAGFALESFDVAGGWREKYRAVGEEGDPVQGIGKNGHAFEFRLAQPVDCGGELSDGRNFQDIRELKRLFLADERAIARNLVKRLIVYATGTPVSFGDRPEVERILDQCAENGYGVRSLVHAVVHSELF